MNELATDAALLAAANGFDVSKLIVTCKSARSEASLRSMSRQWILEHAAVAGDAETLNSYTLDARELETVTALGVDGARLDLSHLASARDIDRKHARRLVTLALEVGNLPALRCLLSQFDMRGSRLLLSEAADVAPQVVEELITDFKIGVHPRLMRLRREAARVLFFRACCNDDAAILRVVARHYPPLWITMWENCRPLEWMARAGWLHGVRAAVELGAPFLLAAAHYAGTFGQTEVQEELTCAARHRSVNLKRARA